MQMWKLQLWLWLYGFSSLLFPPHAAWQTDFTGWVRVGLQEWECRPIDTGADTETSTSVPTATHMNGRIRPRFIYLYLHVFPLRTLPASCFSSFLGIRKKKTYKNFLTKPHCQGEASHCLPLSSVRLSATAACNSIQHLFAISVVN